MKIFFVIPTKFCYLLSHVQVSVKRFLFTCSFIWDSIKVKLHLLLLSGIFFRLSSLVYLHGKVFKPARKGIEKTRLQTQGTGTSLLYNTWWNRKSKHPSMKLVVFSPLWSLFLWRCFSRCLKLIFFYIKKKRKSKEKNHLRAKMNIAVIRLCFMLSSSTVYSFSIHILYLYLLNHILSSQINWTKFLFFRFLRPLIF